MNNLMMECFAATINYVLPGNEIRLEVRQVRGWGNTQSTRIDLYKMSDSSNNRSQSSVWCIMTPRICATEQVHFH